MHGVIRFHILYNAHQIWQLFIMCISYNSKHNFVVTVYNRTWNKLQKQQYVHRSNSLLCFLQAMHGNIACACIHSRVFMLCMNCSIMGNSFYMNSLCGLLKLNLPRVPKMLRPAVNSCICRMTQLHHNFPTLVCCSSSSNSYSYIATAS